MKNNKFKRVISMLVMVMMVIAIIPTQVFAKDEESYKVYDNKYATIHTKNNTSNGGKRLVVRVFIDGQRQDDGTVFLNYTQDNIGQTTVDLKNEYSKYKMRMRTCLSETDTGKAFSNGNSIVLKNPSTWYLNINLTTRISSGDGVQVPPLNEEDNPITNTGDIENFPGYPNEGSVKIDKDAVWNGDAWDHGVSDHYAKVNLTASAVPKFSGVDTVLILDKSGSMKESTGGGESKIIALKKAASDFLDITYSDYAAKTPSDNRVAIVAFSTDATSWNHEGLDSGFGDKNSLADGKKYITRITAVGGTQYNKAMNKAKELINGRKDTSRPVNVIFISDGVDNNRTDKADMLQSILTSTGVVDDIYTIGLNLEKESKDDQEKLEDIASSEAHHISVNKATDLGTTFNTIARASRKSATQAIVHDSMGEKFNFVKPTDKFPIQVNGTTVGPEVAYWDDDTKELVWNIINVPEGEATLTYYVKLKDGTANGAYPTNTKATLKYVNYNNYWCEQTFPIPTLVVPGGSIRVIGYEVNEQGNAVDATTGAVLFDNTLSTILTNGKRLEEYYVTDENNTPKEVLTIGKEYTVTAKSLVEVENNSYTHTGKMREFNEKREEKAVIDGKTWTGALASASNAYYIMMPYVKQSSYNVTVNHKYGNQTVVKDNDQSKKYVVGDEFTVKPVLKDGYEYTSVAITPNKITADNKGVIKTTMPDQNVSITYSYSAKKIGYTVEYYMDGTKFDPRPNQKDLKGTFGISVDGKQYKLTDTELKADPLLNGYKFDNIDYGYNGYDAVGMVLSTEDVDNEGNALNIIKIKYTKRSDLTYIIKYWKDKVDVEGNELGEDVTVNNITFNQEVTLTGNQLKVQQPDGYKAGVQQGAVPVKVTADGQVINVLYEKDSYTYTVEYYQDSMTGTKLGTLSSADVKHVLGTQITNGDTIAKDFSAELNGKDWDTYNKPEGYKFDSSTLPVTIGIQDNVIKIVYVKDSFDYKVHYFKDNEIKPFKVDSTNETAVVDGGKLNGGSKIEFGSVVQFKDANKYKIAGYKDGTADKNSITITAGENVINVYYVKDTFGYTVEYYKDTLDTANKLSNTIIGTAEFDSMLTKTILDNVAKKDYTTAYTPDGYTFTSTTLPKDGVKINANSNVIKVLYNKKTDIPYSVEYYKGDTSVGNKLDGTKTGTATFGEDFLGKVATDNADWNSFAKPTGYKYSTNVVSSTNIKPDGNVMKVVYVPDLFGYTINHIYLDNTTDMDYSETKNADFDSQVGYTKNEKANYKFEKAVIDNVDDTTGNGKLTITQVANNNVINVYYTMARNNYIVEYYADSFDSTNLLGTSSPITADVDTTIEFKDIDTTMFIKDGYKYDSAINLPLTVSAGVVNVIKVLYTKNQGNITVNKEVIGTTVANNTEFFFKIENADGSFSEVVTLTSKDGKFKPVNVSVEVWGVYTVTEVKNAQGDVFTQADLINFDYIITGGGEVNVGGATLSPEVTITNTLKEDGQLIISKETLGSLYNGESFDFQMTLRNKGNRTVTEDDVKTALSAINNAAKVLEEATAISQTAVKELQDAQGALNTNEIHLVVVLLANAESAKNAYDTAVADLANLAVVTQPVAPTLVEPTAPTQGVEGYDELYKQYEIDLATYNQIMSDYNNELALYNAYVEESNRLQGIVDTNVELAGQEATLKGNLDTLKLDAEKAQVYDALNAEVILKSQASQTATEKVTKATDTNNALQTRLLELQNALNNPDSSLIPVDEPIEIIQDGLTRVGDGVYTFKLTAGSNITINGLPVTTEYVIVEQTSDNYTTTVNGQNGNSIQAKVKAIPTVTFTNTFKSGSITVTKQYVLDNNNVEMPKVEVTLMKVVTREDPVEVGKGTIGNGESFTVDNLPVGEYYAVEGSVPQNFKVSYSANVNLSANSATGGIVVTNTYASPSNPPITPTEENNRSITVSKKYIGEAYAGTVTINLYLKVDGGNWLVGTAQLGADESQTIKVNVDGTYYVEEILVDGYTATYSGEVTISGANDTKSITVTNTKEEIIDEEDIPLTDGDDSDVDKDNGSGNGNENNNGNPEEEIIKDDDTPLAGGDDDGTINIVSPPKTGTEQAAIIGAELLALFVLLAFVTKKRYLIKKSK